MNALVLNIIVIAEQSLNTSEDAKLFALRAIVRSQRNIKKETLDLKKYWTDN